MGKLQKFLEIVMFFSIAGSVLYLVLGIFTLIGFNHLENLGKSIKKTSPFNSGKAFLVTEFLGASALNAIIAFLYLFFGREVPKESLLAGENAMGTLQEQILSDGPIEYPKPTEEGMNPNSINYSEPMTNENNYPDAAIIGETGLS
ncbi:MAG: hypothetical protein MJ252_01200 [archaeon]|nr:hypothetical protein [archaeon]